MDTYGGDDAIIGREGLVRSFFSGTGKSYDRVVRMFTLGLDDRWKGEIVRLVPDSRRILDLGCGTGILTERLAMTHPRAEIVGVDITPDYLAEYEERLRRKPWIHARPMLGNAETVSLEGEFDAVVSSYLIKYVDADLLLNNTTPHLRRGGAFIAHDFTLPTDPIYLNSWRAYTWAINRIGPMLFPEFRTVFDDGLTGLLRRTRWPDDVMRALRDHGYEEVRYRRLSFQTAGLVSAVRA